MRRFSRACPARQDLPATLPEQMVRAAQSQDLPATSASQFTDALPPAAAI